MDRILSLRQMGRQSVEYQPEVTLLGLVVVLEKWVLVPLLEDLQVAQMELMVVPVLVEVVLVAEKELVLELAWKEVVLVQAQ